METRLSTKLTALAISRMLHALMLGCAAYRFCGPALRDWLARA